MNKQVKWHCSDADSGPDVGLSLTLDGNRELWCGEISLKLWLDLPAEGQQLGDDTGWWIILYDPEPTVIGRCVSQEAATTMMEAIA